MKKLSKRKSVKKVSKRKLSNPNNWLKSKLKESIDIELGLPIEDRTSKGIIFLRECYSKYEKIWDLAPHILKNVRFIRPSYDPHSHVSVTVKQDHNTSEIEQTEMTISETLEEDRVDSPKNKKAKTIFFA